MEVFLVWYCLGVVGSILWTIRACIEDSKRNKKQFLIFIAGFSLLGPLTISSFFYALNEDKFKQG